MAAGGVLGNAAECRLARCCALWCAFDGFRTTYLGISAFTSPLSLIRSSPPTRRTHNVQERFACKSSCNQRSFGYKMEDCFVSAQFEIRSHRASLHSIFADHASKERGDRLLPSYCTCAIDQRNTRYHPSIECSVYFKSGSQSDSTLLLEGRVAI